MRQEGQTHMDDAALVILADIRGFTGWARDAEVFAGLEGFVSRFLSLIRRHFGEGFVKGLGDGAMIVRQSDAAKAATYPAILAARCPARTGPACR
jgi:class 3 adenylate cyclase